MVLFRKVFASQLYPITKICDCDDGTLRTHQAVPAIGLVSVD